MNVADGYAYCVGGDGLKVFDVGGSVGAPDDIQLAGEYVYPHLTRGVGVHQEVAYMVPGQSVSSLMALDVGGAGIGGTPENPMLVDSVDFPPGTDAFCVAFSGQYAFVGTHSFGLRIIQLWQ